MTIWQVLGIGATSDERDIKRAYARKLKVTRPEDDPTAFQLLNDAFQHALAYAKHLAREPAAHTPESVEQEKPAVETAASHTGSALAERTYPVEARRTQTPVAMTPAPPASARPSPLTTAKALWAAFVKIGTVQPRMRLAKLAASEALVNMDVREQFELCAVRHGASAACSDEWREAMVQHFGWENDHALIFRASPDESHTLFARLRAQRAWLHLLQKQGSNPALHALMAERPRFSWIKTSDGSFMKKMRLLLAEIATHYPELFAYRLDPGLVDYWQRHVERKRFYLQTVLFPIIAGLVLTILFISYLPGLGVPDTIGRYLALAALPVTMIGTALYAFNAPGLRQWLASPRVRYLLDEVRQRPQWQYGWLLLFAPLSALLFVPEPAPWLQYLVGSGLLACTMAALFANLGRLQIWLLIFATGCAIGVGDTLQGVLAYDAPAQMLAGFCAMILILGGGLLLPIFIPLRLVTPLRCAWIAGTAIIIWFAPLAGQHPAAFAALTWLWLLAGMLLCYMTTYFYLAVAGGFALRAVLADFHPQPGMLLAQPMFMLLGGLLIVTIFMILNLWRVLRNQHPF